MRLFAVGEAGEIAPLHLRLAQGRFARGDGLDGLGELFRGLRGKNIAHAGHIVHAFADPAQCAGLMTAAVADDDLDFTCLFGNSAHHAVGSFFQTKETVSRLLAGRPFDAVLSADDSLAIGAAKALREAGRDPVPMIGFNNTVLGRCATPELSSFDIDMKQLCRLTVRTLLDVLQGQTAPSCLKLEGKLVERASLLDFES